MLRLQLHGRRPLQPCHLELPEIAKPVITSYTSRLLDELIRVRALDFSIYDPKTDAGMGLEQNRHGSSHTHGEAISSMSVTLFRIRCPATLRHLSRAFAKFQLPDDVLDTSVANC